ncbi:S8 family serine peptidase [Clostridium tagluense]|uniref:S8 family serine peptidase n=1 Tax=Clostridium tagluense TaxID=360422 RepID=UPI001CF5A8D0|nr:S8 family serine peptidase [Clostridium tagluense]MCB2296761.1 S8 family serine peptidase [Clostridium tagluense]
MNKKLISAVVTATLLATSSLPAMAKGIQYTDSNTKSFGNLKTDKPVKSDELIIKAQISKAILGQGVDNPKTEKTVELLLVCEGSDITQKLESIGAEVNKMSTSVYVVNIPANKASNIGNIKEVKAVGRDKILQLPKPIDLEEAKDPKGGIAEPNLEYCNEAVGMTKFWRAGFDGKGTKIAIIDTGVEPGNEMLTLTTDGKIKIVDYQDFYKKYTDFGEGDVKLKERDVKIADGKKYIEEGEEKIYLPANAGEKVLFGYFFEEPVYRVDSSTNKKIPHDLNNNGTFKDKFPVVVMDYSDSDKVNDKVFVDTNADNDFTKEKEMGVYKELVKPMADKVIFEMGEDKKPVLKDGKPVVKAEYEKTYNKLSNKFLDTGKGKNPVGSQYNFVATEVENRELKDGSKQWIVNLGYDGNEHGSHVSGDAAGNGYQVLPFVDKTLKDKEGNLITDGTLKGAAPGAQIMACRVFQSHSGTPQSAYMAAMEYACENGADTVNMSLGSLPDLNDQREPSAILVNTLTKKYGTIFAISAGNEGPVTNSIGTPGTSEWAVTVGAYNPAWSNYGYPTVPDNMWYFSSNGPTEDGRLKPTIVAPGSQISSYPMWFAEKIRAGKEETVGHGLMQGTSMSSPYTAGVLAALKQAINEKGIAYHPLVVKEAIFETGNKDLNNEVYKPAEIGGGMIDPNLALTYLEGLKGKGLNQESLKKDGSYIDRNDIVLKTEFNYTEKLNYNPEGLYVRNGDIPNEVKVTITNTKNQAVNVNLVKDSYNEKVYKTEWLTLPQNTLKLSAGESKTLTLKIDKSKLNQGVNSLIIRMDDPSTALNEGFIPITLVNYLDLNIKSPVVTESQSREIGLQEWDKHFIKIPNGTEKVKITLERNDKTDLSYVSAFVAEPSGIQREDLGGARLLNVGKQEIILDNPTAGTWEVAVYSGRGSIGIYGPDAATKATGKHTIKAEMQGVVIDPSVVSYEGKAGEYIEKDLAMKILNATENDSKAITLKATGLVGENTNIVKERKTINNGDTTLVPFTIPENDANIVARFHTRNAQFAGDDIDLELYKVDEKGELGDKIASSGNGGSDEDIYLESLKAGKYALAIIAYGTADVTNYDFTMQVANSSHGEKVIEIKNPNVTLNRQIANISCGLKIPNAQGTHRGFIIAVDEKGNVVGKAKVEAKAKGIAAGIAVQTANMPKEIKLATDAKIEINAVNYTLKDQEATLIFAVYDRLTNKLVGYAKDPKIVKAGGKATLSTSFKMPTDGDYIVKCFVWDSIEGQESLSEVIQIPVVK